MGEEVEDDLDFIGVLEYECYVLDMEELEVEKGDGIMEDGYGCNVSRE